MSEKGYLFMLLVSFSVTDIPIPPPGFFQKSNRNNKNTDVIIIHKPCSNLDNGCKVKEKRCNCKIFVRIIAEKISILNSAAFFLVRKFYMLRCFLGLYTLIWGSSVVLGSCLSMKSPTQTNGEYENHKEMLFIQGKSQSSTLYLYIGSERSAFLFSPILLARWQNAG